MIQGRGDGGLDAVLVAEVVSGGQIPDTLGRESRLLDRLDVDIQETESEMTPRL